MLPVRLNIPGFGKRYRALEDEACEIQYAVKATPQARPAGEQLIDCLQGASVVIRCSGLVPARFVAKTSIGEFPRAPTKVLILEGLVYKVTTWSTNRFSPFFS